MQIPVYILSSYGAYSYYVFDTDTMNFREVQSLKDNISYLSLLPVYDGWTFTCMKPAGQIAIILGKNNDKYVISTGWSFMHEVTKDTLLKFKPTNWYKDNSGRIRLRQGSIVDLSDIFKNDKFICSDTFLSLDDSSSGEQRKIFGRSKKSGLYGIVKFPISNSSKDIQYEVLYRIVGKQLGIPVVRAELGVYSGKPCVISIFEYDKVKDHFITFYKYMQTCNITESEIISRLSDEDRQLYLGYLVLDYIMNQSDRHLRNLALCNGRLYPLYDNGRCLGEGIGMSSLKHREAVERNIREWNNRSKFVNNIMRRFNQIDIPVNFSKEHILMKENYNNILKIIN